jgi:tRNA(fMet)-specific endonuclease VapC
MVDFLVDTDICIWHLRGREVAVSLLTDLASKGRLGVSVITRAEILTGMRPSEEEGTMLLLDGCSSLPITAPIADRAGELLRSLRTQGVTMHLPDAMIAATAIEHTVPLFTCNSRHYPVPELMLQTVRV